MSDLPATNAVPVSTPVVETPPAAPTPTDFHAVNGGAHLYRLFLLDVDTDPDDPKVQAVFKRGDDYPDVQSRVRSIIKGEPQKEHDSVFTDEECTTPFVAEEGNNWNLTLVRKTRTAGASRKGGVDREWLRMVLNDPDKSPQEKLEAMQKFV